MPLQPVTFSDFGGGKADLYIGVDTSYQAENYNFLLDETKKPIVRPGTYIYANPFATASNAVKPTGIYLGPDPLSHPFVILGPHAFQLREDGAWAEISGVNTSFLPTKTDSVYETATTWRRQLIAAAPMTGLPPAMIYCTGFTTPADNSNRAVYKAVTLGLPDFAQAFFGFSYSAGSTYNFGYQFFRKYTYIDHTGTLFSFLSNPTSTLSIAAATLSVDIILTGATLANTALTNYDVDSRATTNATFSLTSKNVTVASATGIVVGAQVINSAYVPASTVVTAINGTTLTLNNYPVAAGTSSTTFSTLTIQIYRTINGGTVLFYLDQIANGTTTYTDTTTDAVLQLRQTIYTSGGALGYEQPPTNVVALTQVNQFFWYATETTLYQSIQGAPGACPSGNSDQMEQKIRGLSDILSFPILFCERSAYRIEGTFDSFGNNGFVPREISRVAGCVSNRSIVKTPAGLIWMGTAGIFHTDGYKVQDLTKHLNTSYSSWASPKTVGEYDPNNDTVIWTVNDPNASDTSTDAFLVLHLFFGLSEKSVFTVHRSKNNLMPSSLCYGLSKDIDDLGGVYSQFYKKMLFTDERGYLLWFDPKATTDVWIDTNYDPADMAKKTIIYSLVTAGLDQGIPGFRKYTPEVMLEVDAATPVAIQIQHKRDDGAKWSGEGGSPPTGQGVAGSPGGGSTGSPGAPEIRQDGPITWNITDCLWRNDPDEHYWNANAIVSGRRTIPAGQIRSGRRQLRFTNAFTIVAASDSLCTCTIIPGSSGVLPTVQLTDSSKSWITDPEGYWITFEGDGYNQTYEIIRRISNAIMTISDPFGTLTAGATKWEIKGYRKFERPRFLSFTLYAEVEGSTYGKATQPQGANA